MTIQNPRQLRGLAILSSGLEAIKRVSDYEYQVKSQHGDHYYTVKNTKFGITCTCPNWQEYQTDCKHIFAVTFSMQLRLEVEKEIDTNNILKASEIVVCPECESDKVIKFGRRKCKKGYNQRYECKSCNHTFVVNRELSRLKATPEVICVSMDLYFKGVSLAKIKHHLKLFYNLNVGRNTIMRWIHKFSKILSDYSEKYQPEVGDLWHSDEMTAKNRANGKGVRNHDWIWNLMDSDTRYLLASKITKTRTPANARKPLREGKKRAGKTPKALITDGQQSYNEAVKKEFRGKDSTIHFRTRSNRKQFLNQNLERMNGTVRERLKVMRGYDHRETGQIILDGERFYYNNIRPHESLKGMTPGQVAGLPHVSDDDNPWLTYIKKALEEKNH
ncbi:MAG: DDE-type integrase/transposase/recombinase [Thermoplasmata archaeon]|nr:MAG: DDE-type integrase/transposase/recombinase [Thermoplasmata archaeon]